MVALRRDFDGRRDDVAGPITLAGRNVAGQHESGERRERNVMRAADAGFEHASAPHRNAVGVGEIVNLVSRPWNPPTRPSLMLMTPQALHAIACSA